MVIFRNVFEGVLTATHVHYLHFADVETFVDVLGCFEDFCLENVVGIELSSKLELVFIVFLFLLDSLIFCYLLVVQGHLLGLISDIEPA